MTTSELASYIDHTVLKPDTRAEDVARVCAEAALFNFAAVCIAPRHVARAAKLLGDTDVHVATVAGFPNGDTLSRVKADETRLAIEAGAHEVDMVIAVGAAIDGDWKIVHDDIHAVVKAAHGHAIIKVILETAYLNDEQKRQAAIIARDAGADYVKTSTGFAAAGATLEDVRLMRAAVGETVGVKAAGGIRDLQTALDMIEAGATRLGCSSSVAIMQALEGRLNNSDDKSEDVSKEDARSDY